MKQRKNYALSAVLSLAILGLLTACGTVPTEPTAEINRGNLPLIKEYDGPFLDKTAQYMDWCAKNDSRAQVEMCELANDYGIMRDETRVILGENVDITR